MAEHACLSCNEQSDIDLQTPECDSVEMNDLEDPFHDVPTYPEDKCTTGEEKELQPGIHISDDFLPLSLNVSPFSSADSIRRLHLYMNLDDAEAQLNTFQHLYNSRHLSDPHTAFFIDMLDALALARVALINIPHSGSLRHWENNCKHVLHLILHGNRNQIDSMIFNLGSDNLCSSDFVPNSLTLNNTQIHIDGAVIPQWINRKRRRALLRIFLCTDDPTLAVLSLGCALADEAVCDFACDIRDVLLCSPRLQVNLGEANSLQNILDILNSRKHALQATLSNVKAHVWLDDVIAILAQVITEKFPSPAHVNENGNEPPLCSDSDDHLEWHELKFRAAIQLYRDCFLALWHVSSFIV